MPDETITPSTEAPPPPQDVFTQRTGINLSDAGNKPFGAASEPVAPVAQEPAKAAPVEAAKPVDPPAPNSEAANSWSMDKIFAAYEKDLKPDDPRLKNYGFHKELTAKVVAANEAQALRIMELEKAVQERQSKPEPLDPSAYQLELTAVKERHAEELKEYNEWKAKQDLTSNEAFRREFDGKRVELLEEARATGAEVGLEQEKVDALFEAKTELQIRKAVKALELEDEAAEGLLLEKALASAGLERKKEALLSGKSGKSLAEQAAEWKAHLADYGVGYSQKLTTAFQGLLLGAVEKVPATLSKESPFFATEQGKMVFEELGSRFRQGYDLEADEVVRAFALARVAPIFEKHASTLAAERDTLKAQLETLTKGVPGSLSQPGGASGGRPVQAGSFHDPFTQRTGIDLNSAKR